MLLGQSPEWCPFCPHVQQSTSLASFRGLSEENHDEGLSGSRVVLAILTLEAFNVLVFELKEAFSLLARKLVVGEGLFLSAVL